ncbi:MAG: iron ABC transporter permease [Bacteroidota bacterium]
MNSQSRRFTPASSSLLFIVVFFACGYIVFPLYGLMKESLAPGIQAFSLQAYLQLFRPSVVEATFNSVLISILSVIGSAVTGTFIAYVFQYFEFPAKRFFSKAALIPLALPPLVGVISFLFLVGESGMLSRILSSVSGIPPVFFTVSGWTGIVIVHTYSFYVYFYLFVSSALSQLDGNALDASASLGATRVRTTLKILLPMLTPSLVGASLITFMASMASFSAPLLFGGTTRFLTLEIYTAKLNGDNSSAAALAILLLIISACILFLLRWWQGYYQHRISAKGPARTSRMSHGRFTRIVVIGSALALAILFALPVVTIVVLSFVKEGSWTYQIFPSSFTVDNYFQMFNDPQLFDPFINSFRMALTAAIVIMVVGISAAYLISRKKFTGNRLLEIVLSLPFGVPGTVIAVGLIFSFNRPSLFSFQSVLVGTFWIMPIAYAVRNLPLLYRSTVAGLDGLDSSLQEAAETMGSSGRRTFRKIIVPLILPSIVSGTLLVFINSVGEFVSSILLYSYNTKPVSVEILSQLRLFDIGGAAVYSTLLMVFVMTVVAASNRYIRSSFNA